MIIFNNTSAEIKTKSANVLLKMIIILKELRIAQQCSKNERTLVGIGLLKTAIPAVQCRTESLFSFGSDLLSHYSISKRLKRLKLLSANVLCTYKFKFAIVALIPNLPMKKSCLFRIGEMGYCLYFASRKVCKE